jgi:hypothetical protein
MKIFFSVIIIFSVLSFQFSEGLIFVSFKINQEYIAKNLCVEKDVAGSTCKGCCQLKKKLNEQQEQKKQLPPEQNEKLQINLFLKSLTTFYYIPKHSEIIRVIFLVNYSFKINQPVFHPPKMV